MAESFTDAKANVDRVHESYTKKGLVTDHVMESHYYPFNTSSFDNFFDYGPLLYKFLNIEEILVQKGKKKRDLTKRFPKATGHTFSSESPQSFRNTEKKVLMGLVEHPELPDNSLADEIGVSRRTIGRLRHQYLESGLIKEARMVNLKKLGFTILDMEYVKFNLRIPHGKTIAKALPEGQSILDSLVLYRPPIFSVVGDVDAVNLTPYESFNDLRESNRRYSEILQRYKLFADEPKKTLYSIHDINCIVEHDYSGITGKLLGMG